MWYYKGEEISSIEDFPPRTFGFVYRVIHEPTGKIYIGKKVLQFTRKAKLTKKDLAIYEGEKGRKPTYKQVTSESDWKTYYGSHKEIMALIKEGKQSDFRREILTCVSNKKLLRLHAMAGASIETINNNDTDFNYFSNERSTVNERTGAVKNEELDGIVNKCCMSWSYNPGFKFSKFEGKVWMTPNNVNPSHIVSCDKKKR